MRRKRIRAQIQNDRDHFNNFQHILVDSPMQDQETVEEAPLLRLSVITQSAVPTSSSLVTVLLRVRVPYGLEATWRDPWQAAQRSRGAEVEGSARDWE